MKKIAITQRLISNENYQETRECLDICYADLIRTAGFLPIILPYNVNFNDYFSAFHIDGILLTGGNDLFSCNQNKFSKQRDTYEKKLIEYAIEKTIPLYGICRGLQIIAEYFGSTIHQVDGQIATSDDLQVNANSKYYKQLSKLSRVNSYHNYAVKKIGNGLLVSATSSSGIIKAVEHETYYILAQMWHSEREIPFKEKEIDLIRYFFNVE